MPRRTTARSRRKATNTRAEDKQPGKEAPIATLSPETLVRIFELYIQAPLPSDEDGIHWRLRLDRRAVLALVCRFWKNVLYGCKRLWSTIDINKEEQSKLYLANATGAPLRIVWDISTIWRKTGLVPPFPSRIFEQLRPSIESIDIVWNAPSVYGQPGFVPVLPIDALKPFQDKIESIIIADRNSVLRALKDLQLPALRELEVLLDRRVSVQYGWNIELRAPGLTRLHMSQVTMAGSCLRELLQGCSALEDIRLSDFMVVDQSSLTNGSVVLPRLKMLALAGNRIATMIVAILLAIRDIRSTIHIDVPLSEFTAITEHPDFRHCFIPFHATRLVVPSYDRLSLVGEPRENAPTFVIMLQDLGTTYGVTHTIRQYLEHALFHKIPLDLLQLRNVVPLGILPSFKTIDVNGLAAHHLFLWLRAHGSDERVRQLECLVLEDVCLIAGDPDRVEASHTIPIEEAVRGRERTQAFSDLQNVLRARHKAGSPIRLVFRSGSYDNDVIEALRPFAQELEVDPACLRSRRSSRLALRQK